MFTPKPTDNVFWGHYNNNVSKQRYNNPTTNEVAHIENIYLRRFQEMSLNRFKWSGLPDHISTRFLEKILFENAIAVMCAPKALAENPNEEKRVVILRGSPAGEGIDYQDEPLAFNVYGNDLINETIDSEDCVPIWANMLRTPELDIVRWYSRRLAEVERTIDINLKSARRTRVLLVPEQQRLTAVNVLRQVDEGEPAVLGGDKLDMDMFQSLDMGLASSFLSDVPGAKNKIFNDCMTMLGINNSNQDKKERMVVNEVNSNDDQVGINRAIALNERKKACEKINKLFNLNVTVEWSDEITNTSKDGEVADSGNVHHDALGNQTQKPV